MKKLLILTPIMAALSCAANAEVRINGFANIVGGITSSDDTLLGYDDKINFRNDSMMALQLTGDINDKTTATAQVVAKGENDFDANFEWAYLTYQATDNTSFSAGRFRMPLFKYSASLDVGYSYHWISPPSSVYNVLANNVNGVKFEHNNYAGDWEYNIQSTFGTFSAPTALNNDYVGDDVVVLSIDATYNLLKLRTVYGRAKTTLDFAAIEPALQQLEGVGLAGVAENLRINDDTISFVGIGAEVDMYEWFVSSEFTQVETEDSLIPKSDAFYVTAGIRTGKFTPSITYEKLDANADFKFLGALSALPEQVRPVAQAIVAGIQQPNLSEFSQVVLALRYDYDTNIALKVDATKYTDDIDDIRDATLVRFAINYVF